jgi:hypothetical protein
MATRRLEGENWETALLRIAAYRHPVTVAWAADRLHENRVFELCAREAIGAVECRYQYDQLDIGVAIVPGAEAAKRLREGVLTSDVHFVPPTVKDGGTADWVTSNFPYGVTSTLDVPAYHFDVSLNMGGAAMPDLGAPVFGEHLPYYPNGSDALLELLYGITRHQKSISFWPHIVIRLPYLRASIRNLYYVEGDGITIDIHERESAGASGHQLHVAWMLHDSDPRLSRTVVPVAGPGSFVVKTDADPSYVSVALLSETGEHRDSRERYRPAETLPSVSLHPAALADAFDYTASVWKDVVGERLLLLRTTSAAAALSTPVETRSDFESRLSSVSALMKAISIPDSLLSPDDIGIDQSHSVERMKAALRKRLSAPDLDRATKALGVFAQVNDVRVALQHPDARRDLPAALARMSIAYPPDWPKAWDVVRTRLIAALADVRDALQSAI